MVFFALVTACRLAGAPTRISPLSVYATTEGVVRAPSLFSMTLGLPPSITATQELVVPRSMPMIFAMIFSLREGVLDLAGKLGGWVAASRARGKSSRARLGDDYQRGTQHPVVEQIALLK